MSERKKTKWWNRSTPQYSKSYEYHNRAGLFVRIGIAIFLGLMLLNVLSSDNLRFFASILFLIFMVGIIFWFIFIWPKYVSEFIYIADQVTHKITDGMLTRELIMYKWDNKLFYSLSDIEVYEEFDKEGIRFIDLKPKKPIENKIDGDKLWDKIGESHKSFKVFEEDKK